MTKLAPYAVGAMTPIKRMYAYMAKKVLALVGENLDSHPYKKWIETYSSPAYEVYHQTHACPISNLQIY